MFDVTGLLPGTNSFLCDHNHVAKFYRNRRKIVKEGCLILSSTNTLRHTQSVLEKEKTELIYGITLTQSQMDPSDRSDTGQWSK